MYICGPERNIVAVKRSVHFVLRDDFFALLDGLCKNFVRVFWKDLDYKGPKNDIRKAVRDAVWSVWKKSGQDVLSVPYVHNTAIVIQKAKGMITLSLKEDKGKITELNVVVVEEPPEDEQQKAYVFERIWNGLIGGPVQYPRSARPITLPVADIIVERYHIPRPVVLQSLKAKFVPSLLTNGVHEAAKYAQPKEVFHQNIVDEAVSAGEAEWVDKWTFKVNKNHYQEWRTRVLSYGDTAKGLLSTPDPQGFDDKSKSTDKAPVKEEPKKSEKQKS